MVDVWRKCLMGPLRPFRGGLFESPPQEAHLPFCRPLHISRVSLSLRYIMNLLHQDDFLTAKTRFCAGKIIVSESEETSKQKNFSYASISLRCPFWLKSILF